MPYCRECGSKLLYERGVRAYVCPSCGLIYTSQDLITENQRKFDEKVQSGKKKVYEEYLEWWLSKK